MNRSEIDAFCATLPGATAADPTTELDSWKVGGKMFATFGIKFDGVSVKTDSIATAAMLIDAGVGKKAPYFHASWILMPFDADPDELRHRLRSSYEIVVKGLPKKHRPQA